MTFFQDPLTETKIIEYTEYFIIFYNTVNLFGDAWELIQKILRQGIKSGKHTICEIQGVANMCKKCILLDSSQTGEIMR